MNESNMNEITKIPLVIPPIVPTVNIDKSVFWALLLGIGIGVGLLSSGKSKRFEITFS